MSEFTLKELRQIIREVVSEESIKDIAGKIAAYIRDMEQSGDWD